MITHEIIDDPAGLASLEAPWNELANKFSSPLLDFDWFISNAETIHRLDKLHVIVVRNTDRVTGIAPLYRHTERLSQVLRILGTTVLYEPAGLLYEDRQSLRRLLDAMFSVRIPVDLARISDAALIEEFEASSWVRSGVRFMLATETASHIDIDTTWQEFERKMSSRRRSDLRRATRKAAKLGAVRFKMLAPTSDDLSDGLDLAMKIEDQGWKGRAGSSMLKNDAQMRFFTQFCTRACRTQSLRLFFYYVDDVAIAMQIAVESHNSLWILKIGHRDDFAQLSPGIVLMHESIRYCFENALSGFQFLGSTEAWLSVWPKEERQFFSLISFPWSLSGLIGLASAVARRLTSD